jgi:hypothetical protein
MVRASRSIVYSAKAYVVRVIPVKRVTDAMLAFFDVADILPQRGPAVLVEEIGEGLVGQPWKSRMLSLASRSRAFHVS